MKICKPTLLACAISSTLMSGILHAATTLDMAIVIDESGSMSGEHNAFIGTYVRNLDSMPTRVWRCIVVRSMPKVNISARSRMAMPYVKHWRYCKRFFPFASAKTVFIATARVRVCNIR